MQNNQNIQKEKKIVESYSNLKELPKKNILGVGITDASKENILEFIISSVKKSTKPYYIVTPNPEMIVLADKSKEFKNVLNNAKLALNDGVGIGLAARFMGSSLTERFTGVDLVEKVCEKSNDWPITVGFLGSGPGVAEKAAECLKQKHPQLQIVFAKEEWVGTPQSMDILFVAFGAPKQEFWMRDHIGKINAKVMVGVGGALDYISGKVPRAPKLVRVIGCEWLFRLVMQPWRIKRQTALIIFVWMVVKELLSKRES